MFYPLLGVQCSFGTSRTPTSAALHPPVYGYFPPTTPQPRMQLVHWTLSLTVLYEFHPSGCDTSNATAAYSNDDDGDDDVCGCVRFEFTPLSSLAYPSFPSLTGFPLMSSCP